MTSKGWVPALAISVALCGCAAAPKVQVRGDRTLPPAGSYRMAAGGQTDALVAERLAKSGYAPAPADGAAAYTIQAAYSVRPIEVGAYVPGDTAANAPKAVLAEGGKAGRWPSSKRQAYSLTLDISETATGKPLYRSTAASQAPINDASRLPALLAAAAVP